MLGVAELGDATAQHLLEHHIDVQHFCYWKRDLRSWCSLLLLQRRCESYWTPTPLLAMPCKVLCIRAIPETAARTSWSSLHISHLSWVTNHFNLHSNQQKMYRDGYCCCTNKPCPVAGRFSVCINKYSYKSHLRDIALGKIWIRTKVLIKLFYNINWNRVNFLNSLQALFKVA